MDLEMLSGLLITLNILVCIALIAVVLLQRSEGGAFGTGGGPTGLITTRGAGDLLTRTTWVLFGLFMALSLGLTLLGAHDRTTSSLAEKLRQQHANIGALGQTNSAPAETAPPAPAPTPSGPASPFLAPPLTGQPSTASSTPAPSTASGRQPAKRPALRGPAPAPAGQSAAAAPARSAPAPGSPFLLTPPPQPAPRPASSPAPKPDPNAPASTGTP